MLDARGLVAGDAPNCNARCPEGLTIRNILNLATGGHQEEISGFLNWSSRLSICRVLGDRRALEYAVDQLDFLLGRNPYNLCMFEGRDSLNPPRYHHCYDSIPGRERGAIPGAIPNGFVRDVGSHDRSGFDLSAAGQDHPSYRTSEPWLVHDVFYLLAMTALHEALE